MTEEKRYLPLFDEDGEWIVRPDVFVFVRMGVNDDQGEDTVWETYRHITEISNNTKSDLSAVDKVLRKNFILANPNERRYAAMVLIAMLRLYENKVEPTLGKAVKLVARSLYDENKARAESSISDHVKRAFRKWRSTCHLEAALDFSEEFENDPEKFDIFLAKAKAFEMLMDHICAQGHLEWEPWRVPDQIEPAFTVERQPLSDEERALINAA